MTTTKQQATIHTYRERKKEGERESQTPCASDACSCAIKSNSMCACIVSIHDDADDVRTIAAGGRFFWNLARTTPLVPCGRTTCACP